MDLYCKNCSKRWDSLNSIQWVFDMFVPYQNEAMDHPQVNFVMNLFGDCTENGLLFLFVAYGWC